MVLIGDNALEEYFFKRVIIVVWENEEEIDDNDARDNIAFSNYNKATLLNRCYSDEAQPFGEGKFWQFAFKENGVTSILLLWCRRV